MEVKFLGTSSGWPLPRLGCKCGICTSVDPKDKRLRPAILVNETVLIDAPPDIYTELKEHNIDPTKIDYIVITHAHDDHIMGLYDLSHIYGRKEKPQLITTEGVLKRIRSFLHPSLTSFKQIPVKPLEKVLLKKDYSITLVPVEHTVETYAVKIKAPKPFVYAPEFRKILSSLRKHISDVELIVIDGSSKTLVGQARGHETIEEGLVLASRIKSRRVLFTNIGHKTDLHEHLDNFVKQKGGLKFGIAYDGLKLKL